MAPGERERCPRHYDHDRLAFQDQTIALRIFSHARLQTLNRSASCIQI